jgi:hypothetical protein
VSADHGGSILVAYKDYIDGLRKQGAEALPPHRATNHEINLEPASKLLYGGVQPIRG